jgi:hypothetical protein
MAFIHHGKLDKLNETRQFIYNTGLAQAGLKPHPDEFDMEIYAKDFMLGSNDSKFYIYMAVEWLPPAYHPAFLSWTGAVVTMFPIFFSTENGGGVFKFRGL